MQKSVFEIEANTAFSDSLFWKINRDYYTSQGIDAWRSGDVPSHLTSNSLVGRTYAEIIFGFLKDLAYKGATHETVYLLELGAGHGKLAFHILKHLERLSSQVGLTLPPYCYVLSDIVDDNLEYYNSKTQFQPYFEKGTLDVCYFDAIGSETLELQHSKKTIHTKELNQPIVAIANYFFDSIPKDLFQFTKNEVFSCDVAIHSNVDPAGMDDDILLESMQLVYSNSSMQLPHYNEKTLDSMLDDYSKLLFNTYLFIPTKGFLCLDNISNLSTNGMIVLSLDKGYHEIHDLENMVQPKMITHGSVSFNVNFHAYGLYCEKLGGKSMFPKFSTEHLELACLFFMDNPCSYTETEAAYHRVVNEFGPDDFNGLKKFNYKHVGLMSITDIIGFLRLGAYDSQLFINFLPTIKKRIKTISVNARTRIAQTLHETWNMYYFMESKEDLAFEMGGIFYELGLYEDAIKYFEHSKMEYEVTPDLYYNSALCYYQLRQDEKFSETLKLAKERFPNYKAYKHLDRLDLNAE